MQTTAPKKVINGWAMFDWANSVYNLVITTTFFPIYFLVVTKQSSGTDKVRLLGRDFINSSLYDYSLAAAYLLISICYPILTSIADTRGNKKNFMRFFCYMGAAGCGALFFFDSAHIGFGIIAFMLASMGYNGSLVFYNAYLPEIAAPEDRDRVSSKGYAYGYVGSVILQIVGFVLVLTIKDQLLALRLNFLLVGVWWAGFAQITFRVLPKIDRSAMPRTNVITDGFREIKKVFGEIKKMPVLKRYLRGFFFYIMGVQTVMLASTLFGSKLLHLDDTKLIVTVVLIQLVAIVGAIWMSRLSARFGNFQVLMGVIMLWIFICVSAYVTARVAEPLKPYHERIAALKAEKSTLDKRRAASASTTNSHTAPLTRDSLARAAYERDTTYEAASGRLAAQLSIAESDLAPRQGPVEYAFYLLALAVGLVMGGIQSLSRSTYAKLMPETKDTASYFSYYDLTEKLAIVAGLFSFGYIEEKTGSMKNSILFLIIFFAIGLLWLYSALVKQRQEAK